MNIDPSEVVVRSAALLFCIAILAVAFGYPVTASALAGIAKVLFIFARAARFQGTTEALDASSMGARAPIGSLDCPHFQAIHVDQ